MVKKIVLALVILSAPLFAADKYLSGHKDGVWKVRFSPEGDFFLTAGGDGLVKMWWTSCLCSLTSFEHDRKDFQVYDAEFFPDGRVISTSLDNSVYVWFRETGDKLAKIEGHSLYAPRVKVSADGSRFFVASSDGKVRIYDSTNYALLDAVETKSPVGVVPLAQNLVTVGLDGVLFWDLAAKKVREVLSSSMYFISAEPLSDHEALVGGNPAQGAPLQIWDTTSRQVTQKFDPVDGMYWQLASSKDGKWVGASAYRGQAHVWDRATGKLVYSTNPGAGETMSLDFFPEGRAMLVGFADGTTRVVRF